MLLFIISVLFLFILFFFLQNFWKKKIVCAHRYTVTNFTQIHFQLVYEHCYDIDPNNNQIKFILIRFSCGCVCQTKLIDSNVNVKKINRFNSNAEEHTLFHWNSKLKTWYLYGFVVSMLMKSKNWFLFQCKTR